jgi:hypothetical protein
METKNDKDNIARQTKFNHSWTPNKNECKQVKLQKKYENRQ